MTKTQDTRTARTDAELYAENVAERASAWDHFLAEQAAGRTR